MGLFQNLRDRYLVKPVADQMLKSISAPKDDPVANLKVFNIPTGFNESMASYNKRMISANAVDWPVLRSLSVNHETTRAAINVRKREITSLGYDVVDVEDDVDPLKTLDERKKVKYMITHIGGEGVRFREILDRMIEDTLVLDACVFYKQRTLDDQLLRIIPIDATTIKLRVDEAGMTPEDGEYAYEQWISGNKTADLTTKDITYEMMNPRTDNPYGLSPLESLIITLDSSMRAMLYNLAYLSDNSVPQGFINVPESWKVQQIKEYTEYLHALISGAKQQAKIFPIPAGAKYIPTSKPTDFMFKDFFDYLDRKVCMMFDVTPQELGLSLQQYKENAEGQDRIQIRKGIKPLANFLSEIFTDLIRKELGYPEFAFKFTGLDFRFSIEEAKTLVPLGILGIDEYRNDMGLVKLDVDPFIIAGNTIMPVDHIEDQADANLANTQSQPNNSEQDGGKTPKKPNKPKANEEIDVDPEDTQADKPTQKLDNLPKPMQKIITNHPIDKLEKSAKYKGFHTKVRLAIRKQILPFTKEENLDKVTQTSKADVKVGGVEDIMPTFKVTGLDDYLKWAATQGGDHTYKALQVKSSFSLPNPKFQELLGDRSNYLIDSVDDTTKQYIVDTLSQGHADGLTNGEIAQQIHDELDDVTLARANTITNTETANATMQGTLQAFGEQGVQKKVWVLSEDIGDQCGDNAADGAIDVTDNFSSGDDAPPAHPNCRCFLQADVSSIEAMENPKMKKEGWVTINGNHVEFDAAGNVIAAPAGIMDHYNEGAKNHVATDLEGKAKLGAAGLPSNIGDLVRSTDISGAKNPIDVGVKILQTLGGNLASNHDVQATIADLNSHQLLVNHQVGGKPLV